MFQKLKDMRNPPVDEDKVQRYRNHEAVVELLEVAHNALLSAGNRAALYDSNLEHDIDIIREALEETRAEYGA